MLSLKRSDTAIGVSAGVGACLGFAVGGVIAGPMGSAIGAVVCAAAASASISAAGAGYADPPKLYTIHDDIRDNSFAFKHEREERERVGR